MIMFLAFGKTWVTNVKMCLEEGNIEKLLARLTYLLWFTFYLLVNSIYEYGWENNILIKTCNNQDTSLRFVISSEIF